MPYKGVRNLNGRWVACINSQNLYFHAGSHGTEEAGAKSLDRYGRLQGGIRLDICSICSISSLGAPNLDRIPLFRFLYLLHKLHNFTWLEGVLQVGLTDEEKRELDELTLEDLQQQVKEEGAAAKKVLLLSPCKHTAALLVVQI